MLDLRSAEAVIDAFARGAAATRSCALRRGCVEVVDRAHPCRRLIATGDLHDNPVSFARLIELAGLERDEPTAHLTLHELIHPDTLMNGMDLSYRVFAKVAALKARHPEHVHVLLANHELAQIVGAGIIKDGVNVVKAFNAGVEFVFGDEAPAVLAAMNEFIFALPLAVRFVGCGGTADVDANGVRVDDRQDLLCMHSLPGPELLDRFDPSVLERELTDDDRVPRRGSAHIAVWGRGQTAELIEHLGIAWRVGTFILGHEKAEMGFFRLSPEAVVLNSDHLRGVFAEINLQSRTSAGDVVANCRPLTTEM